MVNEINELLEFNRFINGDRLVIVAFYAQWCGPYKQLEPFFEKLAYNYQEIIFCKLDVDNNQDISAEFGIRQIPTYMAFRNNEKIGEVMGANPSKVKSLLDL